MHEKRVRRFSEEMHREQQKAWKKINFKEFCKPFFEEYLFHFFIWADLASLILLLCSHCRKSRLNTCKCAKVDFESSM